MNIKAVDLHINRNNFGGGEVDRYQDLRRRIQKVWRTYTESEDRAESDGAYDEWCLLVNELDALELLQ